MSKKANYNPPNPEVVRRVVAQLQAQPHTARVINEIRALGGTQEEWEAYLEAKSQSPVGDSRRKGVQ